MGVIVRHSEWVIGNKYEIITTVRKHFPIVLWYISGMFELLAKEKKTIIGILMPTITLGQYRPYLIILEQSCSTHIVFRKEIKIRPIIIRRPKSPGNFSSVGNISGKSQFI